MWYIIDMSKKKHPIRNAILITLATIVVGTSGTLFVRHLIYNKVDKREVRDITNNALEDPTTGDKNIVIETPGDNEARQVLAIITDRVTQDFARHDIKLSSPAINMIFTHATSANGNKSFFDVVVKDGKKYYSIRYNPLDTGSSIVANPNRAYTLNSLFDAISYASIIGVKGDSMSDTAIKAAEPSITHVGMPYDYTDSNQDRQTALPLYQDFGSKKACATYSIKTSDIDNYSLDLTDALARYLDGNPYTFQDGKVINFNYTEETMTTDDYLLQNAITVYDVVSSVRKNNNSIPQYGNFLAKRTGQDRNSIAKSPINVNQYNNSVRNRSTSTHYTPRHQ